MDTGTSGVFSEFLSSLGVATPDAVQTSAPQAVFAAPTEPAENAAYLGTLLDDLEHGPAKALQEPSTKGPTVGPIACFTTVRSESSKLPGFLLVGRPFGPFSHCTGCNFRLLREAGRRLDGELKEMVKVLEQLRAAWPELRTSVEGAFEAQKHLRTKDLAQALKQVLQFRRHVAAAIPSIEALCEWLEDATEQERLRFKAMTREVLDGQSKVLAARVAAVLWLKRSRGSSIRPEQTRFDIEQASEALERNLEDMENRLVKGAGTVMKREACHQVVQRTVARLSVLRGKVLSAAEAVAAARADLAGARRGGQAALTEAAARALEQLMAAFDESASHVDAGGGRGARGDAEDDSPARDEAPSSPSVAIVEAMRSVSQKDVLQDRAGDCAGRGAMASASELASTQAELQSVKRALQSGAAYLGLQEENLLLSKQLHSMAAQDSFEPLSPATASSGPTRGYAAGHVTNGAHQPARPAPVGDAKAFNRENLQDVLTHMAEYEAVPAECAKALKALSSLAYSNARSVGKVAAIPSN
eukprot:g15197.t1